jgi:hypothetical protein
MILEQWEVLNLVGRGRWVFVIIIIIIIIIKLQLTYSVFVCFCHDVCSFRAQQHMLFDQQASELVNSAQVGWEEGTI